MEKILVIIKREYLTRVRTKAFVIGTILTPILMIALTVLPGLLAMRGGGSHHITVLDQSGDPGLAAALERKLAPRLELDVDENGMPRQPPTVSQFRLTRVEVPREVDVNHLAKEEYEPVARENTEEAYLILRANILDDGEPEYYAKNDSDFSISRVERAISEAIIERRLVRAGVDQARVGRYIKPVEMRTNKVSAEGVTEGGGFAAFIVRYLMLFFTYITVLMYGLSVMRGVIEEKQSRIVEVVVSSVRPTQMMLGKLIGIGLVGLTQVLIWATCFLLLSLFGAVIFRINPSSMPKIPVSLLVYFVLFFVLGYFLFSTLYAIVGAIVSTEEEAQQVQMPVTLLIVAPMLLFTMVMTNPNSAVSVSLSMVPFFAPTLMMLRIAIVNPPLIQVIASMLIMVLTTLGLVWMAAKIYRVGILMYGKRPTFGELGKWLRYS